MAGIIINVQPGQANGIVLALVVIGIAICASLAFERIRKSR